MTSQTPDAQPGINLRLVRVAQGLTQAELASRMSYSLRTVNDIENGRYRMTPKARRIAAAALGVPPTTFVRWPGDDLIDAAAPDRGAA